MNSLKQKMIDAMEAHEEFLQKYSTNVNNIQSLKLTTDNIEEHNQLIKNKLDTQTDFFQSIEDEYKMIEIDNDKIANSEVLISEVITKLNYYIGDVTFENRDGYIYYNNNNIILVGVKNDMTVNDITTLVLDSIERDIDTQKHILNKLREYDNEIKDKSDWYYLSFTMSDINPNHRLNGKELFKIRESNIQKPLDIIYSLIQYNIINKTNDGEFEYDIKKIKVKDGYHYDIILKYEDEFQKTNQHFHFFKITEETGNTPNGIAAINGFMTKEGKKLLKNARYKYTKNKIE